MKRYRFLDERNFRYFCQGLTLGSKDMEVLDTALCGLDKKNKIPSRIVAHNNASGFGRPPQFSGPQVIVSVEKYFSKEKGPLSLSSVAEHKEIVGLAPAVHIQLQSLSLEIPQRVEIPMRYLLKGLPKIERTHMVYLHALQMESGETFVYYGITRRGWMTRFNEHMSSALGERSRLLFHQILREGILGRMIQLRGADKVDSCADPIPAKVMVGNHHVVCGAGLDEAQAMEAEEYLVGRYSFGHACGLNMIPGGKAGLAYLHRLNILSADKSVIVDADRESILESYLKEHPRRGLPNPIISELWKDDDYAAQIICGGERRLSIDQVREIRTFGVAGMTIEAIRQKVGAIDDKQVQRVLEGKTYARVH